jgi:hypothetical protein
MCRYQSLFTENTWAIEMEADVCALCDPTTSPLQLLRQSEQLPPLSTWRGGAESPIIRGAVGVR